MTFGDIKVKYRMQLQLMNHMTCVLGCPYCASWHSTHHTHTMLLTQPGVATCLNGRQISSCKSSREILTCFFVRLFEKRWIQAYP